MKPLQKKQLATKLMRPRDIIKRKYDHTMQKMRTVWSYFLRKKRTILGAISFGTNGV